MLIHLQCIKPYAFFHPQIAETWGNGDHFKGDYLGHWHYDDALFPPLPVAPSWQLGKADCLLTGSVSLPFSPVPKGRTIRAAYRQERRDG